MHSHSIKKKSEPTIYAPGQGCFNGIFGCGLNIVHLCVGETLETLSHINYVYVYIYDGTTPATNHNATWGPRGCQRTSTSKSMGIPRPTQRYTRTKTKSGLFPPPLPASFGFKTIFVRSALLLKASSYQHVRPACSVKSNRKKYGDAALGVSGTVLQSYLLAKLSPLSCTDRYNTYTTCSAVIV